MLTDLRGIVAICFTRLRSQIGRRTNCFTALRLGSPCRIGRPMNCFRPRARIGFRMNRFAPGTPRPVGSRRIVSEELVAPMAAGAAFDSDAIHAILPEITLSLAVLIRRLPEAKVRVIQGGGNSFDGLLVTSQSTIEFGQYRGETFNWMLANDLGYSLMVLSGHQWKHEAGKLDRGALIRPTRMSFSRMPAHSRKSKKPSKCRQREGTLPGCEGDCLVVLAAVFVDTLQMWSYKLICSSPNYRRFDSEAGAEFTTEYLECQRCHKKLASWSFEILDQLDPAHRRMFPVTGLSGGMRTVLLLPSCMTQSPLGCYSGWFQHELNQCLLGCSLVQDYSKPRQYTGELIGVRYLCWQQSLEFRKNFDPDVPDRIPDTLVDVEDEGFEDEAEEQDPTPSPFCLWCPPRKL
ncbi:unnamed protein product [Leuciscus chuanchicus]